MARTSAKSDSGNIDGIDNGPIELSGESGESTNDAGFIDPATIEYGDDYERDASGNLVIGTSGKPRRKRGRKSGGSNGASAGIAAKSSAGNRQTVNAGIETLSQTLLIFHLGIAKLTELKHWELEKKEADTLAASLANVMEQFDFAPDPRFTAIAGLVTTSAMIYGPRVMLSKMIADENIKRKRQEQASSNVSRFSNGPFDLGNANLGG